MLTALGMALNFTVGALIMHPSKLCVKIILISNNASRSRGSFPILASLVLNEKVNPYLQPAWIQTQNLHALTTKPLSPLRHNIHVIYGSCVIIDRGSQIILATNCEHQLPCAHSERRTYQQALCNGVCPYSSVHCGLQFCSVMRYLTMSSLPSLNGIGIRFS